MVFHIAAVPIRHTLRTFVAVFILFLFWAPAKGDDQVLDSLIQVTESMPASKEKGLSYLKLASKFLYRDLQKSRSFAIKGRKIGQELGLDSLEAAGYFREGTAYIFDGNVDSVIVNFKKTLDIADRIGEKTLILGVHINLGTMYMDLGNLDQAQKEFLTAREDITEGMDPKFMRVICNNLGTVSLRKKDYKLAEKYYLETQQYIDTNNIRVVALNYNNLGDAAKHNDGYEVAMDYYMKAYETIKGSSYYDQLANSFLNLVAGYARTEEFSKAEPLLDSLDHYSVLAKDRRHVADAWQTKSLYHELLGDFELALEEYKRYSKMRDSIAISNQKAKLEELQTKVEVTSRDAEIALLEAENALESEKTKQANVLISALGIGLGLVFLALVVLLFTLRGRSRRNNLLRENNRLIQEKNALLEKQKVVLEEVNRDKDGLIGIVAHDLKSPLNKSLALVDVIQTAGPLNEAQRRAAELIGKTNGIGINLIRDLLQLNSLEQEKAENELKRLEASTLFEEIGAAFSAEAGRKGIELEFESPPEGVAFKSHRLSICRILENLISNALKFSHAGTAVKVSASKTGKGVQIAVRDQGPGISQEDQRKLFRKFQRLSAQPTGGESSTGLGLAITKILVDNLGGIIHVESEVGKGTAFVVELPE